MSALDAVGSKAAISPQGEGTGSNFGADAETLALFASLFAIMQTPEAEGADVADMADGADAMDPALLNSDNLPPAAMLMAAHGLDQQVKGPIIDGEATRLTRLLMMANALTPQANVPIDVPVDALAQARMTGDANQGGHTLTATEMLTGAIAILNNLAQTAPAETVTIDDAPVAMAPPLVMLAPTPQFIGPMPLTMAGTLAPSSPWFTGPMPAGPQMTQVALLPPHEGFVGPMPATAGGVMPPPSPQFVGPMPAVTLAGATSVADDMMPAAGRLSPDGPTDYLDQQMFGTAKRDGAVIGQNMQGRGAHDVLQRLRGAQTPSQDRMTAGSRPNLQDVRLAVQMAMMTGLQRPAAPQADMPASAGMPPAMATTQTGAHAVSTTGGSAGDGQAAGGQAGGGHAGGGQAGGGQPGGGQPGGQSNGSVRPQGVLEGALGGAGAGRTMLHRLNTANAGWSDTMIRRLTSDLRAGVQNVRIILEPRQLGRLNVELGLRNGRASIRIASESAEAARLLSSTRGHLSQMLETAGLRLSGFQTTSTGDDMSADGDQGQGAADSDGKNAGGNKDFSNNMGQADDRIGDSGAIAPASEQALRDGETAVLSILA